ncbi:MAG: FAD/NAD(P)-binding oxidoreductase, partial [Dehalococcoidia bacterium]|nr:FAD/NAD(P)-binding oxidoreductase [Dehalococcoidia bacterium]
MKRHVIIGNSHAAISAVQAIRSVNGEDEVILISREDCLAYSPMLTPCYLSGSMPYEGMFFCDKAFYQENKVDTLLGKRVVKVTPKSKSISLDDGDSVSYDTLLIATGSTSRVPPIPGTQLPNVFTLWTAEDARKIGDAMRGAETVAIVGAGLIGIDCVNVAMGKGKKVILIEMLDQVMPQAMDTEGSRIVEARMRQQGVELHLNERLLGIEARRGRLSLSLASGTRVQAQVAILATGVAPNVGLLEGSGVRVATG